MQLRIDRRFSGPPGFAHGGYLAGLLASQATEPLRIRFLRPTPLEVPLELRLLEEGGLELRSGVEPIVRAEPTARDGASAPSLVVPSAPSYLQALEASRAFVGFTHHAFPSCFVCGTERARGDGLRIFAGALPGTSMVAAAWTPDASLADAEGKVQPQFMSAALDCPGYYAARDDGVPMLLGEFTAHVDRCVHIDEPCTLIGWRIAVAGRKYAVGTALFDEDGEPCARAHAVWVEPRQGMPAAPAA